jgi:hypothetical protein
MRGRIRHFYSCEAARQCPLLRVVKVGWKQSKAVGSEESSVIGSGVLEFAARTEVERFGLKTETNLNYV